MKLRTRQVRTPERVLRVEDVAQPVPQHVETERGFSSRLDAACPSFAR